MRLAMRLRNPKKSKTIVKKTVAGAVRFISALGGKVGLTNAVIDKLAGFYCINVRSQHGGTVESLRKAILATYLHARKPMVTARQLRIPRVG